MSDHEYWDELAAGYALHGLAPDEEIVFSDHLDSCEECAASVNDHEMVAAQLGSIAHYREFDGEAPSWESMRGLVIGDRADNRYADELSARRRRYQSSRKLLAAAAAVAVVAGGGVATWRMTSNGSDCSAAAGCHQISLDASADRSVASIVVHKTAFTVTPSDMPAAPAGKVYVLWQSLRDRSPVAISEFTGGANPVTSTGTLKAAYSDTQSFAVSEENAATAPPATPSNELAVGLT